MAYFKEILVVVAGYLVGCVCTGYYLVRLRTGADIRKSGTGSTGARNVSRTLGRWGYAVTLSADIFKGAVVVAGAQILQVEQWAVIASLLAAVIGHIWPMQLRFRGGKGVAVMLGAMLVYDYRILIVLVTVCAIFYLITKKYIISGMAGALALPVTAIILNYQMTEMIGIVLLVMIILVAHRRNISEVFKQPSAKVTELRARRNG